MWMLLSFTSFSWVFGLEGRRCAHCKPAGGLQAFEKQVHKFIDPKYRLTYFRFDILCTTKGKGMPKMNCTLEYVNGHIIHDGTGAFLFSARRCSREALENSKTPLNFAKRGSIGDTVSFSYLIRQCGIPRQPRLPPSVLRVLDPAPESAYSCDSTADNDLGARLFSQLFNGLFNTLTAYLARHQRTQADTEHLP